MNAIMRYVAALAGLAFFSTIAVAQPTIQLHVGSQHLSGEEVEARLSSEPALSASELVKLESTIRANPADKDSRLRLLRQYLTFAPRQSTIRSPHQANRLEHILYMIENFPADPVSSSSLTYVPLESGPYANPADHETVRAAWLRATQRNPSVTEVILNAARFLHRAHPEEAEQLLSHALDRDPRNKTLGANLGFLYALDILGWPARDGAAGIRDPAVSARRALELTQNMWVLAGAGTALPNLFPRSPQAQRPESAGEVFPLAGKLMARARESSEAATELRGPMPLIQEFQEFQAREAPVAAALAPTLPVERFARLEVKPEVLGAKLIEKPAAVYPPLAKQARIQGTVRFNVVVGQDGSVINVSLISGHPLLVPAAIETVRRYRYQPTLLNGSPVQVTSQVDVPFTTSM